MDPQCVYLDDPNADDRVAIGASLFAFNRQAGPPPRIQPLVWALRDAQGETVGGLWGKIAYDWLYVELLAVPEALRGRRLGAQLLERAEAVARERGCIGVWLDTFAFQARAFYEKQGYTVFGELADHPAGSARYFLSKRLG